MNARFDWWCKTAVDQIRYSGFADEEALTLEVFAKIASGKDAQPDYNVPVQIWFYDGRNELIAEETVIISGKPEE